ncbi:lactate utilization protein C [Escherichia coli]|nr:lactate utilization protein C [Escherichia coli]
MENREEFLVAIARKLGRPVRHIPEAMPEPVNTLATTRLTELTSDQRCEAFIKFASEVMLAECVLVSPENAPSTALDICWKFGFGPVIISNDQRLVDIGITPLLQKEMDAALWDPEKGDENIHLAEKAKTGVVFAEYGLTESGGIVLFSAPERGRSVSLLPEASLFVLRKSTILPRVAQLAQKLHDIAQEGQRMPSCINLIGGPSSTADIELIKVVGVHGPVHATYLIIDDCD